MQQATTWIDVDPGLCHHMASLGHNELSTKMFQIIYSEKNKPLTFYGKSDSIYSTLMGESKDTRAQYF